MSKSHISRLVKRIKALGIGRIRTFTPLFGALREATEKDDITLPRCQYWTQEKLHDFLKENPNANGVIETGCPFVPQREWPTLGSNRPGSIHNEEGAVIETYEPTPHPDCRQCEYYGISSEFRIPAIYILN